MYLRLGDCFRIFHSILPTDLKQNAECLVLRRDRVYLHVKMLLLILQLENICFNCHPLGPEAFTIVEFFFKEELVQISSFWIRTPILAIKRACISGWL